MSSISSCVNLSLLVSGSYLYLVIICTCKPTLVYLPLGIHGTFSYPVLISQHFNSPSVSSTRYGEDVNTSEQPQVWHAECAQCEHGRVDPRLSYLIAFIVLLCDSEACAVTERCLWTSIGKQAAPASSCATTTVLVQSRSPFLSSHPPTTPCLKLQFSAPRSCPY